ETASHEHIVHDAATLASYVRAATIQSIYSDGIASLHAYRAAERGDYDDIKRADTEVILCKMNDEARQMVLRMGKKLAELAVHVAPSPLVERMLADINSGDIHGTYPIVQAVVMHAAGISESDMFTSQAFGVANMILGAALRCVRVSHYDTQKILYDLAPVLEKDYEAIRALDYDDMRAFVPGIDLMASLHEKGEMRMFMN
ncbi:urease accessory protein UreF, partial [Muribaculum intestinale]